MAEDAPQREAGLLEDVADAAEWRLAAVMELFLARSTDFAVPIIRYADLNRLAGSPGTAAADAGVRIVDLDGEALHNGQVDAQGQLLAD